MGDVKLYTVHGSITTGFTVEVETDNPDLIRELAYDKVYRDHGYFDEWDVQEVVEEGE